jgi:hypothetical protein
MRAIVAVVTPAAVCVAMVVRVPVPTMVENKDAKQIDKKAEYSHQH